MKPTWITHEKWNGFLARIQPVIEDIGETLVRSELTNHKVLLLLMEIRDRIFNKVYDDTGLRQIFERETLDEVGGLRRGRLC